MGCGEKEFHAQSRAELLLHPRHRGGGSVGLEASRGALGLALVSSPREMGFVDCGNRRSSGARRRFVLPSTVNRLAATVVGRDPTATGGAIALELLFFLVSDAVLKSP